MIISCFGDRTFAAAATSVWNSLPSDVRKADLAYSRFRRSLKTFLFGQPDHGALRTLLIAPCRNILTYLLTYFKATFLLGSTLPPPSHKLLSLHRWRPYITQQQLPTTCCHPPNTLCCRPREALLL